MIAVDVSLFVCDKIRFLILHAEHRNAQLFKYIRSRDDRVYDKIINDSIKRRVIELCEDDDDDDSSSTALHFISCVEMKQKNKEAADVKHQTNITERKSE